MMERINGADTVDIGNGRRGFRDENLVSGRAGTEVTAAFLNAIQEEILNVIADAGLSEDGADWTQLRQSIARLVQSGKWNFAPDTGAVNALAGDISPAPAALTAGMQVVVRVSQENTGPSTFNLNRLGAKPIIYSLDGKALLGKDFTNGSIVKLTYDGTSWRLEPTNAYYDKRYPTVTAPPSDTFYVVGARGSDSNTGLANTPEAGFATIQGAIDAITKKYITFGKITLRIANGIYDGFTVPRSLVSEFEFIGNSASPQSVLIRADRTVINAGRCITNHAPAIAVDGLAFQSYYENINGLANSIEIKNVNCTVPIGGDRACIAVYGGAARLSGLIKVSGSGHSFINASQGGSIVLSYADNAARLPLTIQYDNPNFSVGNIGAFSSGSIYVNTANLTLTGRATGPRYAALTNGIIDSAGSGENYFPGSSAGTKWAGGQYI